MPDAMSKVLDQLKAEESRLDEEIEKAARQLDVLKTKRKRIRSVVSALELEKRAKNPKPTPTKQDLVRAVAALLRKHGPLSEEQLKRAVEKTLTSIGFGMNGLHLRLREALAESAFASEGDVYRLAAVPPQGTSTRAEHHERSAQ